MADVGSVIAKLEVLYDASGMRRYESDVRQARSDSRRPITQRVRVDTDGATQGMDRYRTAQGRVREDQRAMMRESSQMTGGMKRTGAGMMGMAGSARLLAGTAGIGAVAIALRTMYQEQAQSQTVGAQTEAVLKSTGSVAGVSAGQMSRLAEALSQKAAVDDEAVQSAGNLLLTFTQVRNEAGRGNDVFTQAMSLTTDLSRAWGKDLSGSAVLVGKALNDPVRGVSALSRVGIQFTSQQKEQIKTLVESGRTMDAQKIILGELRTQVGGSAEAYGKTMPGAVDRAKVSFQNMAETLGGKLAPAASAAADFVTGLIDTASGKRGGRTAGGGVAADLVKGFQQLARSPIGRGFQSMLTSMWRSVSRFGADVGRTFSRLFSGGEGRRVVRDLQSIGRGIGVVLRGIGVAFGRLLHIIQPIFTGMVRVVRGAIRVITGLLTGDFGRAWDGVVDIVGGAVGGVLGALGRLVGQVGRLIGMVFRPIGRVFSSAWRTATGIVSGGVQSIINAVTSAPGRLLALAGRFASAGASLGRSFINAIGSGLSAAGGFISNIGDSIRRWINAATPFGDTIKLGPVSVQLPALAQGGRVGPSTGGAQVYIAGEGGRDEWVISQEGPRQANIGYAVEALTALTGKRVGLFSRGGRIASLGRTLDYRDTRYGLLEREYDLSGGGTDAAEYGKLAAYKKATRDLTERYARELDAGITEARRGISRNRGKGKKRAENRQTWQTRLDDWTQRRSGLGLDLESLRLDLVELGQQRGDAVGTTLAAVSQFVADRQSAFRSYGGNFIASGSAITGMTYAAGLGAFGAGQAAPLGRSQSAMRASGGTVNITNHYLRPPDDPHSWSQGIKWEIAHAL